MKFYANRLGKKEEGDLTPLDKAVMTRCRHGCDIVSILCSVKPYVDGGSKVFASTSEVRKSISKLLKLKLLDRREL